MKAKADHAGMGHFVTLLNRFVNTQHIEAIDFLLNNGADPNTPNGSISELDYTFYPFYTTSCNKIIKHKLVNSGSKYALNGYLWCIVNKQQEGDSITTVVVAQPFRK